MAAFEEKYDFIGEFHQGVAIVVKNGYYGAIITGGREIIAPSYDYIASFKDGYAQAIRKGECRVLDLSGKECKYYEGRWISIPGKYDSVREFKNGYACVLLNEKWGIIDTDGNEKVEPQFYYISDIISGTAKYKKDYGKDWGFLNVDGYYSECIYSEPQIEPNGDVTVFKNHVKVRINKSGQILVKDGNSIVALSKDFVAATDFNNGASLVQDSKGFWGAVNNKGKTIIPNEYLEIQEFSENKAFAVNKSEKLCLISSDGSVIKVFENYTKAEPFKNGYAIVHEGYYKSGLISSNGNDVLKPLEGVIEYTQKKGVFDINDYGETGLFDASLGLLLLPRYRRIIEVLKDYVRVKVNNTIGEGLVDFSGRAFLNGEPRVILPDWCLGARLLIDDIYLGVSSDGKYGLVSSSGETLCQPSFDIVCEVKDSIIVTETHEYKYGLYNRKNKVSIPTVFDTIPEVLEHFVKVSIKGLLGVIDFEGNEIIKAEWEDLVFENGCFVVGKTVNIKSMYDDKRFGLFNKNGDLIFDTEFQEIIVLREGLYKIRENSLWALYNDDGQLSNDEFEKMFSLKDGFIGVIKNGIEGRIDLNGNKIVFSEDGASLVLPKKYSFVTDFRDGIAKVQIEGYENYVDKSFNIIINNEGTIVSIETKADYLVNGDANSNYYIYVYEGLYGLLSKDGKEIIRAQYGFLSFLSTDLLKAAKPSNNNKSPLLYGIIDIHENEVLGFEYSFIKDDRNKKRKDVFRFDVESQYSDSQSHIKLFEEGKYWVIGQNGSLGLINKDGSVCLKPEYDFIREFEHGFFVMKEKWINGERGIEKCEKWGVIDEAYNTICDSKYDTITQTKNGFYKVSIEEAFGILDPYGQVKLEPKYSFIGDVSDSEVAKGRALIRQGNLYGIIDEKYNVLVEPQYEYISDFKNGKANVGKRIKGASGVEFVCGVIDVDGLFTDISELNKSEKLDFINPEINSCVKKVTTLRNGYIVVQIDYPSTYSQYCAVFDNDYHIVLPF